MQCGRTRCDRRYRCPSIFGCSDKIRSIVIAVNARLLILEYFVVTHAVQARLLFVGIAKRGFDHFATNLGAAAAASQLFG
jgi:hypothetical protein